MNKDEIKKLIFSHPVWDEVAEVLYKNYDLWHTFKIDLFFMHDKTLHAKDESLTLMNYDEDFLKVDKHPKPLMPFPAPPTSPAKS